MVKDGEQICVKFAGTKENRFYSFHVDTLLHARNMPVDLKSVLYVLFVMLR